MICELDSTTYRGRTVTLPADADARTVARAVRDGEATDGETTVRVRARRPHDAHERVGYVHPEMGLRVRTALAAAARVRGLSTHLDGEIRDCRERLDALAVESVETVEERRAVASANTETERLREEVAETRGELTARRERDGDVESVGAQFRDAARALSEAETSAAAARQNLDRQRREARAARDRLERRLELEDTLANLQRQARAVLVERMRTPYERAVAAVPGGPGTVADPFAIDSVTAALAVARVAAFDAPVVLSCGRFSTPAAASAWLDAPVIRVPSR